MKLSDEYRPDWFTGTSALYILAAVYADHPDYQPDWAL